MFSLKLQSIKLKDIVTINSIAVGFALIIILMLIQTLLALWRFSEVKSEFENVVDVYNLRMELVQKMRIISRERAPILFSLVYTEDEFEIDELKQQFYDLGSQFLATRDKLIETGLSDREKQLLDRHRDFAKSIVPRQRQVIALVDAGEFEQARKMLTEEVSPDQIISLSKLDKLIEYEQKNAKKAMNRARELFEVTQRDLILTTIFGSIISLLIGIFVSVRFTHFINTLKKNKEELEKTVEERTRDLLQVNEQLQHLANYDTLTELPNRSLFLELLSQGMKQMMRCKKQLALFFIDLDGFKGVNDTYGHDYGDELLKQVATRMTDILRGDDVVSRLGGDEFTLIASNITNEEAAAVVARKIIKTLSEPFQIMDQTCHIGSSIGIAIFPVHTTDLDELISFADAAMYDVKRSGKNNFRIFQNQTSDASKES